MKPVAERFGPQILQEPMLTCAFRRHQVHRPESARIVERHTRTVFHVKHHMVMLGGCRMLVVKCSESCAGNQHPSGHAQMHEQGFARRKVGKDVFRPPPQALDPLAAQAICHLLGQWKAQVRAVDLRQSDQLSFHHRQQPGANGFHFW